MRKNRNKKYSNASYNWLQIFDCNDSYNHLTNSYNLIDTFDNVMLHHKASFSKNYIIHTTPVLNLFHYGEDRKTQYRLWYYTDVFNFLHLFRWRVSIKLFGFVVFCYFSFFIFHLLLCVIDSPTRVTVIIRRHSLWATNRVIKSETIVSFIKKCFFRSNFILLIWKYW